MAKNNMNFNATLRLTTDQFKKGVADVKRSLDGLKRSFLGVAGALGAGLGLTQLLSNLKNTAVQLSVAKNTLENVSNVTKKWSDGIHEGTVTFKNYGENLNFVKRLSDDYSQDLVAITQNFAQFHAACEKTNLSLDQQKLVFEALTKAAAYYHMSSDRTKDMMNAVTQMMSKGKVAAEELRRQLGNALPGAFNLMAAAMGVSTSQLDEMMRKGQVIASEVLPKFAAMLNTVTEGANFDSLQLSMNRLKNSWYGLVENFGAEKHFTWIVNEADKLIKHITMDIEFVKANINGLIVTILSYKLFDTLQKRGEAYFTKMSTQLKLYERELERFQTKFKSIEAQDPNRIKRVNAWAAPGQNATASDLKDIVKFNNALIKTEQIKRRIGGTKMLSDDELANLKKFNAQLAGMPSTVSKIGAAWKNVWMGVKSLVGQIAGAIASMGIMAIVSTLLGFITTYLSYVKEVKKEWERINNIVADHQKAIEKSDTHVEGEIKKANAYYRILSDTNKTERQRLTALKELNKLMGTSFSAEALDKTSEAYKKITKEVKNWADALKIAAKIQVVATRGAEAQGRIEELQNGLIKKRNEYNSKTNIVGRDEYGNDVREPKRWFNGAKRLETSIKQDEEEIKNLQEVVDSCDKELDKLGVKLADVIDVGGKKDEAPPETDIKKVFDKYNKDLKELDNKLRERAITQEEYNEEFDKLVSKYWDNAAATGQLSIDKIIAKMEKGKTLTKMERWYHELMEAAVEAAKRAVLDDAAESMAKELADAIEQAIKDAEKELDERLRKEVANEEADMFGRLSDRPQKQNRDTLFDYKKSKSDILGEEADNARANAQKISAAIEEIKDKYENVADAAEDVKQKLSAWTAEMKLAEAQAGSLEEAMKFQQIQEDIKKLNDDINKAVLGGIKNLAQSTDRVVKGMETLKNTLEDTDASGWEKFMAVFNEIVQIVEMFASISETLNTIEQASQQLAGAELALEQQKVSMLEQELRLRLAIKAAKAAETTETEKEIAADIAEAAASQSASSAKAGEAVAGATAAGAEIPFPYNIIAIAAGVAAVVAALASMSKYAKGGIVGGNSYSGDRQMARVNSGEMILNKAQQGTLWNMLNGKGGVGSNVQFKIRGTDLIGVINNEQSKRRG